MYCYSQDDFSHSGGARGYETRITRSHHRFGEPRVDELALEVVTNGSSPAGADVAEPDKPKRKFKSSPRHHAAELELNRWAAQCKHEMPMEVSVSRSRFPNAVVDRSGKALIKGPKGDMIEVDAAPRSTNETYYLPGDRSALTPEAVTGYDTSDAAIAGLPDAQRQNLETIRDNNSGKRTSKPALAWSGAHESIQSLANVENLIADVIREWVHEDDALDGWLKRCSFAWTCFGFWFCAILYRHQRAVSCEAFVAMLLWIYPKTGIYASEKITTTRRRKVGKRTYHDSVDLARTPRTFALHANYDLASMCEVLRWFRPGYYRENPKRLAGGALDDLHKRLMAKIGEAMRDNPAWGEKLPPRNAELLALERRRRNVLKMRRSRRRVKHSFARPGYDRRFCERMVGRWLSREPAPVSFERLAGLVADRMTVVRDKFGRPIEIKPSERVSIHPGFCFGAPRVLERVTTSTLYGCWKTERESIDAVAVWYGVPNESVQAAVAFEQLLERQDPQNRKKIRANK